MKKFFGVLFFLFGLAMIATGIYLINGSAQQEIFVADKHVMQAASTDRISVVSGYGLILGGVMIFVTGLVLMVAKTSAERKREVEMETKKKYF